MTVSTEPVIGYCFTLQSPWAFLGHPQLIDIARRHGARIDYKPMSLGEVFPASGGLPLAERHLSRQTYRAIELKRWRARRGVTFNAWPKFWPLDVARPDRVVIALVALGLDPEPFVARAYAGIWQEERDLADDTTIAAVLAACDYEPASVMAEAGSARTGEAYRANGNDALAAGVFGSPTYLLRGEPFWGQDRLDFLDEALASGREPLRA